MGDACRVALRARWVMLRARWVMLRARWVAQLAASAQRHGGGAPHWTAHWAQLPVDTKLQWYTGMFTAEMCDTRCAGMMHCRVAVR